MSDQFNRGGKNDGNRKYQSINLSQHFSKRDNKSAAKSTTGRGLQSLGKVGVSSRRLPRPAVCSSLKKENAGNDPNVALVPGVGGWGSKKGPNQVEVAEGDKGWKEVEDKPPAKTPGFSQDFPSLGEEAPSSRVELRPHTVKWGEKQSYRTEDYYPETSVAPGHAPVLPINYIYNAPPPQNDLKNKTEEIDKLHQDTVTSKDQWSEELKGSTGEQSQLGYISPYTQPFPGTPGKLKEEDAEQQQSGKPPERITYHGRTSSHSSLSDPPHDELELEDDHEEASAAPRVLSRSIAKKELKAFPREEEEKVEAGEEWEEEEEGEKRVSVWESKTETGNVWKLSDPEPPVTSADRYFEEDYVPRKEPSARERMDSGQRKALQDVSHCINNMSKQITIRQKPKVEILQKGSTTPSSHLPSVTANYWQNKLAERERQEAEVASREEDYRSTPESHRPTQYTLDVRRQEEAREYEQEKRSIRRRAHDEFYDNERKPERRTRRPVEEVFRSDTRSEPRSEPRSEIRSEIRSEPRSEIRSEIRSEPRVPRRSRESRFVCDAHRGGRDLEETYDRDHRERPRRRERERERERPKRPTRRESKEEVSSKPDSREKIAEETASSEKEDYLLNLENEKYAEVAPSEDTPERERRDPLEKYDRHHYERSDFTTYRREPRGRGDRPRERRPRQSEGIFKLDEKRTQVPRNKARIEKYKAEIKVKDKRSVKSERTSRKSKDHEGGVSSDEQKPKLLKFKFKSTSPDEDKRADKDERPPRRAKKAPSLKYYSANPADRVKTSQSVRVAEEKPKEKVAKSRREPQIRKDLPREAAKEEPKPLEAVLKTKIKESSIDKKVKKVEKSKFEMDRLKKMTQSGVDLLTLGIYAVDGKEIDDLESADLSEGFVEVVRKKSKKEPEPEKKSSKTKKKKTLTSKTKKGALGAEECKQQGPLAAPPSSVPDSAPSADKVKQWPAPPPEHPLMSNIWINPKKNAWDKPLTFSEKEHLETREKIAPISGESTSLFSSDADLAKKTKEKNWRSSENRPPRFSKPAEKGPAKKPDKKKEAEKEVEKTEVEELTPIIPPVVEDLFGIRSDGEDEKPSLTSLVLENKVTSPVISKGASPDLSGTVQIADSETPQDLLSTETATQTTPPAPRPPEEAVTQLITPAANLSLTDQLREIGQQAQLAPPLPTYSAAQTAVNHIRDMGQHIIHQDRHQLFGVQNSPLMPGLHTSRGAYNEAPGAPAPPLSQPLLEHFITPPPSDLTAQIIPAINQLGTNNSLIGSHAISSSLSSLGNIVNRPNTTVDFLKNYMAPISPTNKIYPVSNHSFVNQNIHHFMANTQGSMSPIPRHSFSHKASSPKLPNLYGTRDSVDPSGMVTFTQQLHKQHSPNAQQLFYQRMVPGQELYYKMKPSDSILLQSDMSKHLDAKPFNPAHVQLAGPVPRPVQAALFKPELLQQVIQPNNLPHHGNLPSNLPHHGNLPSNLPHHGFKPPATPPHDKDISRSYTRLVPEINAMNGLLQQSVAQSAPGMFPESFLLNKTPGVSHARSVPRVKLARDGRLHRVPDIRSKFTSLIPPSVQQHMQQQSLAQIQQYQAVLSRGEDPAKGTLPENMKPLSTSSPTKQQVTPEPPPLEPPSQPDKPECGAAEGGPKKDTPEKRAEKRKHNEIRNTYRRRNYGYPPNQYEYYDNYHEDPYREGRGRGGYRGRYPPPPLYRGYPPPPFRRGAPPRPRY